MHAKSAAQGPTRMTTGRDRILGRIRERLGRSALTPEQRESMWSRNRERRLAPASAKPQGLADAFANDIATRGITVGRCRSWLDAGREIAQYVNAKELGLVVRADGGPHLRDLRLQQYGIEVQSGPADANDAITLTEPLCAIAETGAAVAYAAPDRPATLNFVAKTHVMVLAESRVVASLEDSWGVLRSELAAMPRYVVWIAGVSSTSDIEHNMVRPAHGPTNVHIVLVADASERAARR